MLFLDPGGFATTLIAVSHVALPQTQTRHASDWLAHSAALSAGAWLINRFLLFQPAMILAFVIYLLISSSFWYSSGRLLGNICYRFHIGVYVRRAFSFGCSRESSCTVVVDRMHRLWLLIVTVNMVIDAFVLIFEIHKIVCSI